MARSIAEKEEKGVLLGSDKWKKEKEVRGAEKLVQEDTKLLSPT